MRNTMQYEFVVAETRVVKCSYFVEAENEEEAKQKALNGETIESVDLETDSVIDREIILSL